jgi:hypothetical protein
MTFPTHPDVTRQEPQTMGWLGDSRLDKRAGASLLLAPLRRFDHFSQVSVHDAFCRLRAGGEQFDRLAKCV